MTIPTRRPVSFLLAFAFAALVLIAQFAGSDATADAAGRPPAPGTVLAAGQFPHICGANDAGATGYDAVFGYYWSPKAHTWMSAPQCYPKWGNLEASPVTTVKAKQKVTVTATPNGGSNSATYAPETKSISWQFPGKRVAGCGSADLTCTVVVAAKATDEWQWGEFHVSMPRTFFVDSPGSNCAGQHLCAGVTTNAWTFVGVPPSSNSVKATVVDADGDPMTGVKVTASGSGSASGVTDRSGHVEITLPKDGSYVVKPTTPGVVFEPASKRIKVSGDKAAIVRFQQADACTSVKGRANAVQRFEGVESLSHNLVRLAIDPCSHQAGIDWEPFLDCGGGVPNAHVIVVAGWSGLKGNKLPMSLPSIVSPAVATLDSNRAKVTAHLTVNGPFTVAKGGFTIPSMSAEVTYASLTDPTTGNKIHCQSPLGTNIHMLPS